MCLRLESVLNIDLLVYRLCYGLEDKLQKGTKQNKTNIGQFAAAAAATKTAEKCCPTLQILLVNSRGIGSAAAAAATSGGQHDWRVSLSNNRTVTQPALSLAHAHAQL